MDLYRFFEAAFFDYYKSKLTQEVFDLLNSINPKHSKFIINTFLNLSDHSQANFLRNRTFQNQIKDALKDFDALTNNNSAIDQGLISSKDLHQNIKHLPGNNSFEKLLHWKDTFNSGNSTLKIDLKEDEYEILYKDKNWLVVESFSYNANIYFGRTKCDGKTCVSNPKDKSQYIQYKKQKGSHFYWIRHLPFDNLGFCCFISTKNTEMSDLQDRHNVHSKIQSNNLPEPIMTWLVQNNLYIIPGTLTMEKLQRLAEQQKFEITINNGLVDISKRSIRLANLHITSFGDIRFGTISGDFDCSHNQLTTLEGAPQIVKGDFYCINSQLTTLEGAPQIVKGDFYCTNNQLTTLEGAPQIAKGSFDCDYNQLVTLKGAPQTVNGSFDCSNNRLTTLEGAPQTTGLGFRCTGNPVRFTSKSKFYPKRASSF